MELLIDFLDVEISVLDTKVRSPHTHHTAIAKERFSEQTSNEFTWTDSKSDLIELLHSILLLESINQGKVHKGRFILFVGKMLNINLKNHSGLFNDILNRYDNPNEEYARIYYLKRLIKALDDRLRQLDSNNRKG